MSPFKLKLLGQMECQLPSGELLSLSTRKSEALLAYLALAPGIRHSRDRLVNLLWSDRGEDQARNSLRQSLSSLKKNLDEISPGLLDIERTTIRLNAESLNVDVLEFKLLVGESDLEDLSKAAKLYQGEFLEGMVIRDPACEQWLAEERGNLKRLYVDGLSRLGRLQLETLDSDAAIQSAERLVAIDSLDEMGWRMLMSAYQQKRNRNHALMAYKRCCEVLQRELGVEPEAETRELQQSIKEGQSRSDLGGQVLLKPTVPAVTAAAPGNKDHNILVLPFKNLSNDDSQQYFSDGLTESIIMGLSLFPSLKVHSRHSSFAASDQKLSVQQIGENFQAQFVVEGSVRKLPDQIRVSAQLVNTQTGEQIWGNRFDNKLSETFALEDQLTRSIVAAIKGKIDTNDQNIAIQKPTKDMQSYDFYLRGRYHLIRFNPKDNRIGIEYLIRCLEIDSENAAARNDLYRCYVLDWLSAWTAPRSECLDKAEFQIRKAMELEPDSSFVRASYAEYLIFAGEFEQAEMHLERALKLNPNDTEAIATISAVEASLGHIESALDLADTCRRLDPFHPWVDWVTGIAYYRGKRYEDAIKTFRNMPNPADEIDGWIAACYQRLGEHEKATRHLNLYLETARKNMADFPQSMDDWKQIWSSAASFNHQEGMDYPFEALCEAGLKASVESIIDENLDGNIPAIIVLPFGNLSNNSEQEYFSQGLTENIITGLVLFPSLKVHSRHTSFAIQNKDLSVDEIGEEFGVDYLVEGSVRKSQSNIRISVQLIEIKSGEQIWGKRFDGQFEDLFSLEDEVTQSIVAIVKGKIDKSVQNNVARKSIRDMQSYDLLMRGRFHLSQFTPEDSRQGIELLKKCLDRDPDNATAHNIIYTGYITDWLAGWTHPRSETIENAGFHAKRAIKLSPENSNIQASYSEYLTFVHDFEQAEAYSDRAIALNPNDTETLATVGSVHACLGNIEKALELADTCRKLDTFHPWVDLLTGIIYYRAKRYEDALISLKAMPAPSDEVNGWIAACYQRLGEHEYAQKHLEIFLGISKSNMARFPETLEEWKEILQSTACFRYEEGVDYPYYALCEAGLSDLVEQPVKKEAAAKMHNIAVLPFDNLSGDPEQEYFSDGITESIIINLSLFPGLLVKSRNSSFAFKEQIKNLGEISKELNVDYVVEGSIRKANDRIRITVQLIEAENGNQIWGNRYECDLSNLFDLEEELSRTIAATVTGQIESDLQRIAISKSASDQQSYDLLLSGKYHCYKFTREDMIVSQEKLEACLELDPANVQAHALLYECHILNWMERWVADYEHAFKLAGDYIQKALKLDPEVVMVQMFYAEYLIFCRENEAAARYVEKVLSINPNNPDSLATKAFNLNAIGEYELALEMSKNCQQLDPYHPWVDWIIAESLLFTGDPNEAIKTILNSKTAISYLKALLVVAYSQVGDETRAKQAMQQFLQLCRHSMLSIPMNKDEWIKYWSENLPYRDTQMTENLIEHLIKAGLCDEFTDTSSDTPSIAVLPFENMSGDPEQEFFSDGITSDIISTLSRFRMMHVVARHSTMPYKDRQTPIAQIAEELQVQYILDGSVRKSGNTIRVNAELIDIDSGENCWVESYDRNLDDVFSVQDEITQSIAVAMKVHLHDGDRARVRAAGTTNIKAWEYCTVATDLVDSYIYDNAVEARRLIDAALEVDPDYSFAWVLKGWIHWQEAYCSWGDSIDESLYAAEQAAQKALSLEPDDAEALVLTGTLLVMRGSHEEAIQTVLKAISIAPGNAEVQALTANAYTYAGDNENAQAHYESALRLSPVCPNWYLMIGGNISLSAGDNVKAIEIFQKAVDVEPESPLIRFYLIDALMEHGEEQKARQVAEEIRALDHSIGVDGLIRTCSYDESKRNRMRKNLEEVGFVV